MHIGRPLGHSRSSIERRGAQRVRSSWHDLKAPTQRCASHLEWACVGDMRDPAVRTVSLVDIRCTNTRMRAHTTTHAHTGPANTRKTWCCQKPQGSDAGDFAPDSKPYIPCDGACVRGSPWLFIQSESQRKILDGHMPGTVLAHTKPSIEAPVRSESRTHVWITRQRRRRPSHACLDYALEMVPS